MPSDRNLFSDEQFSSGEQLSAGEQGHDGMAWLLVLGLIMPIGGLQLYDPFALHWRSLLPPAAFLAVLAIAAVVYRYRRPDPKIVAMVVGLQQVILFTCLGIFLSYMVAARGGAFWDQSFQRWDMALGIDWRAYLDFVNARPLLGSAMALAYASLMPQMIVVILALGFAGRLLDLRTVILAAILSGMAAILISGWMPAMGYYVHLGLGPEDYANLRPGAAFVHAADMIGVRDGSLRFVSFETMQGIITFPSYHAALAAIFGWGFYRSSSPVRWPGVAVASLTMLATPIDGGHYFVDVIAGAALAALSLYAGRKLARVEMPAWRLLPSRAAALRASPFRH